TSMRKALFFLVGTVLCFPSLGVGDEPKKDLEALQGDWSITSAERDGKKAPDEAVKSVKLTFAKDTITVTEGTKKTEMTFKLDPSKSPKTIDLTYGTGGRMGEIDQGIYTLDGDTLKLCIKRGGGRPTEFAAAPDSNSHLLILKKSKP